MSRITRREVQKLLDQEEIKYLSITKSRRNSHFHITLENGQKVIFSSTPSDSRSLANFRAMIRREARV